MFCPSINDQKEEQRRIEEEKKKSGLEKKKLDQERREREVTQCVERLHFVSCRCILFV